MNGIGPVRRRGARVPYAMRNDAAGGGGRLASDEATRRPPRCISRTWLRGTARRVAGRARGPGRPLRELGELPLADVAPEDQRGAQQPAPARGTAGPVSTPLSSAEHGPRRHEDREPHDHHSPTGQHHTRPVCLTCSPSVTTRVVDGASLRRAAQPLEEGVQVCRRMAERARSGLQRAAPRGAGRARHAGDVRAGRRRDRQPGRRDVRGLRLVRDAAAGRLRGSDARAAAGAGGARGRRAGSSCPWARSPRGRPVARRGRDGARGLRRHVRRRGQLRPGGGDDVAAAGLHPPGLAAGARLVDPRSPGRLGPGVGGGAAGHRAAVAGAGARSGAQRGDRGRPGGGPPPAGAGGLRPRRRRRCAGGRARRRDRAGRQRGRGAARGVLRHALPTDRTEHGRPDPGAAGRRAASGSTRSSCRRRRARAATRTIRASARSRPRPPRCSNAAPICWTRRSAPPTLCTRRRPSCARG